MNKVILKKDAYNGWWVEGVERIQIIERKYHDGLYAPYYAVLDGDYEVKASSSLRGAQQIARRLARIYLAEAARNQLAAALVDQS